MTRIVVGVDGSEGAAAALRWGVREGRLHDWPVTALMTWILDPRSLGMGGPADLTDASYRETAVKAARELDAAVTGALGKTAASAVEQRVTCDLAASGLLEAAQPDDLLVVGARGLGGFRSLLLGSVSEQCLRHAPCPIAVVRSHQAPGPKDGTQRIIVGIDGSETAEEALRWALDEARARQASVSVVHAWHIPNVAGYPQTTYLFDPGGLEHSAREVLDAAVAGADTSGLPSAVERHLVSAGAAEALLEASKGSDLIVVGSRGRGGFSALLLGSVSHQLAHHATCPLVVIPPAARD